MIKSRLIYLIPLALGIFTVVVDYLPENLPSALGEYRNIQDVQNFDFPFSMFLRIAFFFAWLFTYIAIFLGKRKYLSLCAVSFIGFIISKLLFGPIVVTAEISILQQLTIFSVGIALGVTYRNGM
ncbi:hypothetical protein [Arenicella xantha]|uniref:Uncharacterized protein n=1 Tax=Arenicella xantha TaxID=644221 RepID=A0A395JMD7_9GAMM|nr:hypothetical protein [Arenicella xantha]RBP48950.1 hypothetical protein DFR28_105290 [Arenicella xantha]